MVCYILTLHVNMLPNNWQMIVARYCSSPMLEMSNDFTKVCIQLLESLARQALYMGLSSQPSENLHLPIVAVQSTLLQKKLDNIPQHFCPVSKLTTATNNHSFFVDILKK